MKYLLPLFILISSVCAAERITCPVTADSWVAMHRWEGPPPERTDAEKNHGQDTELFIQGRTAFALLNFDVSAAKGMTIEKATLRIHRKPAAVPLHTVGISTISGNGPWSEGSINFFYRADKLAWSYPASDLVDVTFAQGGSLYSYQRVRDAGDGWWEFDVPPAIVSARYEEPDGLSLPPQLTRTPTSDTIAPIINRRFMNLLPFSLSALVYSKTIFEPGNQLPPRPVTVGHVGPVKNILKSYKRFDITKPAERIR